MQRFECMARHDRSVSDWSIKCIRTGGQCPLLYVRSKDRWNVLWRVFEFWNTTSNTMTMHTNCCIQITTKWSNIWTHFLAAEIPIKLFDKVTFYEKTIFSEYHFKIAFFFSSSWFWCCRINFNMQSRYVYIAGASVLILSVVSLALQRKCHANVVLSHFFTNSWKLFLAHAHSLLHQSMFAKWSRSEHMPIAQRQSAGTTTSSRRSWARYGRGKIPIISFQHIIFN